MIPLVPAERQVNGLPLESRSATLVLAELTGAPSVTSVESFGQTRRDPYTG
jgi:hypothetical protein